MRIFCCVFKLKGRLPTEKNNSPWVSILVPGTPKLGIFFVADQVKVREVALKLVRDQETRRACSDADHLHVFFFVDGTRKSQRSMNGLSGSSCVSIHV